ncbi:M14 family zinc carboxypeptidase [Allonocardiopsis opalescens]|uniref:Zinc carboxypeptidase n=1 Tax=Allonocardiopsis opalescens TaxID=1144618 RepID=A0A2T0PXI5_9ACTN|nr:M14 family zinc carboxypeptidase [Allonocardiopsis opalescens]PRX96244.1 zinc carboxypeptidase [Allonocardiopsis opalescens]
MNSRLRPLSLLCASVAVFSVAAFAPPAQAEPAGAPADRSAAEVRSLPRTVDPRPSNEELAEELAEIADRSRGRVEVRSIGDSNQGRPVWAARIGDGPVRIQYISQQHGNEPLGAPAALEYVRTLGLGNSFWHRWLRSRVTVDVIVRANPDGHVHDWRYNYDPDADPEYGQAGQGYDINRYHDPAVAPDDNPATEAGHIQRAYAEFRPDIVVDYHMQGRYIDDEGREITASLLWPTHPDVADSDVEAAQQVSVVAERAITRLVPGSNVSLYPGGDYQGIARNAYGLRGSASVLIELSDMGAEHEQAQIRSAYAAMLAVTQSAADGSLRRIDPDRAEQIPPRGEPLPDTERAHPLRLDSLD